MQLGLQVSHRMTQGEEDSLIRLTPRQKVSLAVEIGRKILLTAKDGSKHLVRVEEAFLEDLVQNNNSAFVSQKVFNTITFGPHSKEIVTLGCDPEFILVDKLRRVIPADHWLPHDGVIGSDGPLAELRPAPAEHESEVVGNLRELIGKLPEMLASKFGDRGINPEGHSCWQNYALGFHIHLGAPRALITHAAPKTKEFMRALITVLDYFVGIPALLLEDDNTRRLGNGLYGKPGDYRVTANGTIEYRTPGGFHLRHPEYAGGILGLALCMGREVIESTARDSNNWRDLDKFASFERLRERFSLPQKSSIRWALLEPSKKLAVSYLPNLVEQIRTLERFREHEESIRAYFHLVAQNKQFSPNLLYNW